MRHLTLTLAAACLTACTAEVADRSDDPTLPPAVQEDPGFVLDAPEQTEEEPADTDTPAIEDDTAVDLDDTAGPATYEAPFDGDTFDTPLGAHRFTPYPAGRQVTFADEVSAPVGDRDDWFAFRTVASENDTTRVVVTFTCDTPDVGISARLWRDDGPSPTPTNTIVRCGDTDRPLTVTSNRDYLLRVEADDAAGEPVHTGYTLHLSL